MGKPFGTTEPELELATLIKSELGIAIDKAALRIFIRAHWSVVQGLAHAIHGKTADCTDTQNRRSRDYASDWKI